MAALNLALEAYRGESTNLNAWSTVNQTVGFAARSFADFLGGGVIDQPALPARCFTGQR